MATTDRAILVGINHYPELGDLQGPENDVRAFKDWLLAPSGGDVPGANITTILSSDFPQSTGSSRAKPTTEAFKLAVDDLHDLGMDSGGHAGHRLYLFLAGHGFGTDLDAAALLMANAAAKRTGHHIPAKPYADWFRQSAFFEEVVLLMDCCRGNYVKAPQQHCHLEKITGREPGRHFYGFATRWARAASERPENGDVVQGLFTTALIAGLKSARTPSGEVTGIRLESFIHAWLQQNAPGRDQQPVFNFNNHDDIVFAHLSPDVRLRVTVSAGDAGRVVQLSDGLGTDFQPASNDALTWEWDLSAFVTPGIYKYGFPGGAGRFIEVHGDQEVIDVTL